MELADIYAAKQPAEAKLMYQDIQKSNPTSPAAQIASAKLAGLK